VKGGYCLDGMELTSQVEEAWMRLSARWRGEAADAFRGMYVMRLRESIEGFEAGSRRLREAADALTSELDALESRIRS